MSQFTSLKNKDKKELYSKFSQFNFDTDNISLIRVVGYTYIGYFIYDNDILVIDKKTPLYDGAKVLVRVNKKECIKIYRIIGGFSYLQTSLMYVFPENVGDFKYEIIGVITKIIHTYNTNLMN